MTKVSTYFGLNLSQAQLDFVDIDPDFDIALFVDPYALSIKEDDWSLSCTDHVISYFEALLNCVTSANDDRGRHLMSNLHEPNETCFGFSRGQPSGRGIAGRQSADLYQALQKSEAARTGFLKDLAEMSLFVPGIGPDKISDMTTNVIRGRLIDYTVSQCELLGIPLTDHTTSGPIWNLQTCNWERRYVSLPWVDNKPIIFVPKVSVRRRIGLDSQEFYNHQMLSYLQAEHTRPGDALVEVLKNGRLRVTKKKLKEKYPFKKDDLYKFARDHPGVLANYKRFNGAEGKLNLREFEENFNERSFSSALRIELSTIAPGKEKATQFHRLVAGIITFAFYPDLITPALEHPINDGRKRIDIVFTNAAESGFFGRMQRAPNICCNTLIVECKNYQGSIGNEELDQLAGRFSPSRGQLGFLVARAFSDRAAIIKKCKDIVRDQGKYILPLADIDIIKMLRSIEDGNIHAIDSLLDAILREISS